MKKKGCMIFFSLFLYRYFIYRHLRIYLRCIHIIYTSKVSKSIFFLLHPFKFLDILRDKSSANINVVIFLRPLLRLINFRWIHYHYTHKRFCMHDFMRVTLVRIYISRVSWRGAFHIFFPRRFPRWTSIILRSLQDCPISRSAIQKRQGRPEELAHRRIASVH